LTKTENKKNIKLSSKFIATPLKAKTFLTINLFTLKNIKEKIDKLNNAPITILNKKLEKPNKSILKYINQPNLLTEDINKIETKLKNLNA
jgi:hypothetical protein